MTIRRRDSPALRNGGGGGGGVGANGGGGRSYGEEDSDKDDEPQPGGSRVGGVTGLVNNWLGGAWT